VQSEAIETIQKVLSATGAHEGNVVIMKDAELSGKSNSIPNKLNLSGANCKKIFSKSSLAGGSDKVYKDIVNATRNMLNGGEAKRKQMEMWNALNDILEYFHKLTLSDEQRYAFRRKVKKWGRLYVECFGEQHITHYMVRTQMSILCAFGSFNSSTPSFLMCKTCEDKTRLRRDQFQ